MKLILVSKTSMIEKIFTLICKKQNIDLIIKYDINIEDNVDLLVIDEEFINDEFNSIKRYTKKIGAITSEELPFDKSRDFIINRPFLPNTLEELLLEQINFIQEDILAEKQEKQNLEEEEVITNYVESLADDVAFDIDEESDESIVTMAAVNDGGVLDNKELHKISDILHDDDVQNEVTVDENDWKNISDIIDDALSEVNEYEFDVESGDDKPIKVLLNSFNINELKPFLQKFDQNVIDRLSNGEDVNITLSLKANR